MADWPADTDGRPLRWSARWSLTTRILIVNVLALALLAGAFFYLDSYRSRLVDSRQQEMKSEVRLLDAALDVAPADRRAGLLLRHARTERARIRTYAADGRKTFDSFAFDRTYVLRDPATEPWQRHAARAMDRFIDWIVHAPRPAVYRAPASDTASAWPEIAAAAQAGVASRFRYAADRTPVISAATVSAVRGESVLITVNARDITRTVRAERLRLGLVLAAVTMTSILLSLFLARTIVEPLRRLARAAVQVRLGRARGVKVPRLPSRRDEIGTLARALSDMTSALRERIDAGEHFAADVTHELKNPLASLRSAIEGLGNIRQEAAREQLLAIAAADVRRLDRLIGDISEASRMDAQISRAQFESIDIGQLIEAMVHGRTQRREVEAEVEGAGDSPRPPRLAFARPRIATACVPGDASRLERALDNLIDNALSFARPGGLVRITATRVGNDVLVRVEDDGPGVPPGEREAIFRRFHSDRPPGESFGRHSGLGLAIARTIIEAHHGTIIARDREDGAPGACFEIRLPACQAAGG